MADGEVTMKLDAKALERLRQAADAAGQPVEQYAAELISDYLVPDDSLAEDLKILEEYDRTGISYSVEEAMAVFDAAVKRRFEGSLTLTATRS